MRSVWTYAVRQLSHEAPGLSAPIEYLLNHLVREKARHIGTDLRLLVPADNCSWEYEICQVNNRSRCCANRYFRV